MKGSRKLKENEKSKDTLKILDYLQEQIPKKDEEKPEELIDEDEEDEFVKGQAPTQITGRN